MYSTNEWNRFVSFHRFVFWLSLVMRVEFWTSFPSLCTDDIIVCRAHETYECDLILKYADNSDDLYTKKKKEKLNLFSSRYYLSVVRCTSSVFCFLFILMEFTSFAEQNHPRTGIKFAHFLILIRPDLLICFTFKNFVRFFRFPIAPRMKLAGVALNRRLHSHTKLITILSMLPYFPWNCAKCSSFANLKYIETRTTQSNWNWKESSE